MVTAIEVDAHGQPATVTDADGVAVAYAYDEAGDVTSVTAASGTSTTVYDAAGRPVRRSDPNGHATSFSYDPAGRLTAVSDPLGRTSALAYDAAGNLTQTIDRRSSRTAFAYDAAGRLVRITDALAGITSLARRSGEPHADRRPLREDDHLHVRRPRSPRERQRRGGRHQPLQLRRERQPRPDDRPARRCREQHFQLPQPARAGDRPHGCCDDLRVRHRRAPCEHYRPPGATTRFAYDRAGRSTSTTEDRVARFERRGPFDGAKEIEVALAPDLIRVFLGEAPRLRWLHTMSAGVERFLIPEIVERRDFTLTNNSGSYDVPIAEFVLAAMLAAAKHLPDQLRAQQRSHSRRSAPAARRSWPRSR